MPTPPEYKTIFQFQLIDSTLYLQKTAAPVIAPEFKQVTRQRVGQLDGSWIISGEYAVTVKTVEKFVNINGNTSDWQKWIRQNAEFKLVDDNVWRQLPQPEIRPWEIKTQLCIVPGLVGVGAIQTPARVPGFMAPNGVPAVVPQQPPTFAPQRPVAGAAPPNFMAGGIPAIVPPPARPILPAAAAESPGPGWAWRGQEPVGGDRGAWYKKATGETLHPDLNHLPPVGPHWDWRAPDGTFWRIFPDGRIEPR